MFRIHTALGIFVAMMAASILVGWGFGWESLVHFPNTAPVQPVIAVGLLLLGLGLALPIKIRAGLGLLVVGLGLVASSGLLDVQAFFPSSHPISVTPISALSLVMLGIALQCHKHPVLQALTGSAVAGVGAVVILGYIAAIPPLYAIEDAVAAIAVRTAICLVVLGGGILIEGRQRHRSEVASGIVGAVLVMSADAWVLWALTNTEATRVQFAVAFFLGVFVATVLGVALWGWDRADRLLQERDQARGQVDELRKRYERGREDTRTAEIRLLRIGGKHARSGG